MTDTIVVANARLELLRCLAWAEDQTSEETAKAEAAGEPNYWPTHVPLFVGKFGNPVEDILLAARESAKLGHIELFEPAQHPNGPMVRITPAGYDWIRVHDAIGEAQQEPAHAR